MSGILNSSGQIIARFSTPLSILSNQPAFVSDSISLKRFTHKQNIQRWEIVTNIEPTNDSAEFMLSSLLNGYSEVLEVLVPQIYRMNSKYKTTSTSNIAVGSNVSAGATAIPVSNNNGTVYKGEFIKFSNHTKVYVVTQDLVGNGTLNIFPNLVSPVVTSNTVNYGNNVKMKVRYDIDTAIGIQYTDGILSDPGTVKLIEAL